MIRHIRTRFEQENGNYKPEKVDNFQNNDYIEHESSGDRNKNLLLKKIFR